MCRRRRHPLTLPTWAWALVVALLTGMAPASEAIGDDDLLRVRLEGARRTRAWAIERLLPRPLPAALGPAELQEFERRVRNLGIFDEVALFREGQTLVVRVREKFTLSPTLEFSSGATWLDSYLLLGATEYNVGGTASTLAVFASWEQRGPTAVLSYAQHPYARDRLGLELSGYFTTAAFRFSPEAEGGAPGAESTEPGWLRRQAGLDITFKLPFSYDLPWRLQLGMFGLAEWSARVEGLAAPAGGFWTGGSAVLEADLYTFSDLVPRGWRSTLEVYPGWLLPSWQPRPEAVLTNLFSVPCWPLAVFAGRIKLTGVWGGNVNHSMLLGSLEGVRGLADAFFRNRALGYANLELRQAVPLVGRWWLQAVGFFDGALFQPMNMRGDTEPWGHAMAVGGGLRLVPTALTGIVLRVDLAKPLTVPGQAPGGGGWFLQIGLSQYF